MYSARLKGRLAGMAVLMSKVYACSVLNLAAAASSDVVGGLHRDRNPTKLNGCYVPIGWQRVNSTPQNEQIYHVSLFDPWTNMLTYSPLHKRGWTFQERLLSPRTLHFAHDQVYWECIDRRLSEATPYSELRMPDPLYDWYSLSSRSVKEIYTELLYEGDVHRALEVWSKLVVAYSRRHLTYGSDKLLALSRIANGMARTFKPEDYLAGLWRQGLPVSLLWYTSDGAVRTELYRAPSWSWASIDGQINFGSMPKGLVPCVAKVLAGSATAHGSAFGPVTDGSLLLKGFLTSPNHSKMCIRNGDVCPWEMIDMSIHLDKDLSCSHSFQPANNLFLLPILSCEVYGAHSGSLGTKGLLLEPVHEVKGRFRRVGYFEAKASSVPSITVWKKLSFCFRTLHRLKFFPHALAHAALSRGRHSSTESLIQRMFATSTLEEQYYKELDGVNQYTIEIV